MTFQRPTTIFWIEVEKIRPNELQPRKEFDQEKLIDLSESIKQYGVLQPLVVIRREKEVPNGTVVEYELISGERRLRASKLAGLAQVPVIIRDDEGEKIKLELAIIENLQREDLNPIERALAFKNLIEQFNLKHHEVGARVGKSREFISNTVRILGLPQEMQDALAQGRMSEGHTRPLLMLTDNPEEQKNLFFTIINKGLKVREAELEARGIAHERARKKVLVLNPEMRSMASQLSDVLGTRVSIEKDGDKGKISIDFFSEEEFRALMEKVMGERAALMAQVAQVQEMQSETQAIEQLEQLDQVVVPEEQSQITEIIITEPTQPQESVQPEKDEDFTQNFSL